MTTVKYQGDHCLKHYLENMFQFVPWACNASKVTPKYRGILIQTIATLSHGLPDTMFIIRETFVPNFLPNLFHFDTKPRDYS